MDGPYILHNFEYSSYISLLKYVVHNYPLKDRRDGKTQGNWNSTQVISSHRKVRQAGSMNHKTSHLAKGQLNSEWIYEVIISPKMPTKNFSDFCPGGLLEDRAEIWESFGWHFEMMTS